MDYFLQTLESLQAMARQNYEDEWKQRLLGSILHIFIQFSSRGQKAMNVNALVLKFSLCLVLFRVFHYKDDLHNI